MLHFRTVIQILQILQRMNKTSIPPVYCGIHALDLSNGMTNIYMYRTASACVMERIKIACMEHLGTGQEAATVHEGGGRVKLNVL